MTVYNPKDLPQELLNIPESSFEALKQDDIKDEGFKTKPIGFFRDAAIRLAKNKLSLVSLIIIVVIALMAIFVPMYSGYDYKEQNVKAKYLPAKIPGLCNIGIADGTRVLNNRKVASLSDTTRYPNDCIIEYFDVYTDMGFEMCSVKVDYYKMMGIPEDEYHWFGTDGLGRDYMTRVFIGTRISLLIALISVITNFTIGIVYGAISAYYGGKVDMVLTNLAQVIQGLPYVVVTMLFMMLFGSGMFSIILALCAMGWIGTATLTRAQFYRFKTREYVLAARTLGVRDRTLIFRHILPNCVGPLITQAMISIPAAIFSEAFLSYIGLGIIPPDTSIGVLLSEAQETLLTYPGITMYPAAVVSLLMIAFNLFANGLRDALDPSKRGEA